MNNESIEGKLKNLNDENAAIGRNELVIPIEGALDAFQEGSFTIKTHAEIPIISKQARVVEEFVVSKEVIEKTEMIRDTVKRTDVDVEELDKNKR